MELLADLERLRFASDATLMAIGGGVMVALALVALLSDRRRVKRKHIDRVGWMPWTGVFFLCLLFASAMLTMAVKGWMSS